MNQIFLFKKKEFKMKSFACYTVLHNHYQVLKSDVICNVTPVLIFINFIFG